MLSQAFVLFLVPALLAASAGWDLASYKIPNFLPLTLCLCFCGFAAVAGLPSSALGGHALAGFCGLAAGFALFAFGLIGGGDAKLFAATTLWLGFANFLEYALITSLIGGGLALALISLRKMPIPATLMGQSWIAQPARTRCRDSLRRGARRGGTLCPTAHRRVPRRHERMKRAAQLASAS